MTGAQMEPDRVRGGAAKFDGAADQVESILSRLQQSLQAQGDCWGNDESGQAFSKDYVPGSDGVTEALSAVQEALHNLRGQVEGAANDFESIDQGEAGNISGVEI
ncbi:WXG100 family type VII secretion target [Saccharopolyspora dendranthemae]|uniref:WXG100 family type VII secretion target n=1 Tax=Saccharopolyspora dendranthemae TaxID=1181886 RepID=A0A561TWZ6_9PSEU|nr:WXG100 family type VII secretion target [Saccharopolyspora dendranthemae]TWF91637.1 WXG100 family type VII secretion target [Saccharopolyspora dendranthemae]